MAQQSHYHGGLVVCAPQDAMLERFSTIAAATLEDYGHPVERCSFQDRRTVRITASHYAVRMTAAPCAAHLDPSPRSDTAATGSARVEIQIYPADPAREDSEISELLLVVMLYRMIDDSDVRMIEWLDPLTLLTTEQFLSAFGMVPAVQVELGAAEAGFADPRLSSHSAAGHPARAVPLHPNLPPLAAADRENSHTDVEQQNLFHIFRSAPSSFEPEADDIAEEEASDVRRLAVWGMTGMIAFLSAPVAASVAAVNLLRGEDLRLNTHVLSLTALLAMLTGTGTLDRVLHGLPL